MKSIVILAALFISLLLFADEQIIDIGESLELPVNVFPADGDQLLLVLPSEYGFQRGHELLGRAIAAQSTEVWLADLYAAYFLPVSRSSLENFFVKDIAKLIDAVDQKTGKAIFLMSHDSGVVPMLEGIRYWQQQNRDYDRVKGGVMVSPNLYVGTPDVGHEIEYRSVASQTDFNLYIIQPMLSPKSWQLKTLLNVLARGGSDVYAQRVNAVRDRFFFRPDATPDEEVAASRLARWIKRAMSLIAYYHRQRSLPKSIEQVVSAIPSGAQKGFKTYEGNLVAKEFSLQKIDRQDQKLSDYRGKVVLLNFWASWCPPCIYEMPSMQALKDRFHGRPFEIVAVNMAEDRNTVVEFLQRMNVDFDILMDTDGDVLRQWKVFAYPTSYVLDKTGRIRFAGFGAIDWGEAHIIKQIESLMNESGAP